MDAGNSRLRHPLEVAMRSYKWVHPACGHEIPLSNDPLHDLYVPDDFLEMLLLPKPGAPADIHHAWCHPSNHAYNADKNPLAPLPPLSTNFKQTERGTFLYGAFEINHDPNDLAMGVGHPAMNQGKDLNPANAIMGGLEFGNERGSPPDSLISLGWPGAQHECPICARKQAQDNFDKANQDMIDVAAQGGDWPSYVRTLSHQLIMLNRAKSVMPISLFKPSHPEDPPIIRGPKAEEVMRNHMLRQTADPTRKTPRRYGPDPNMAGAGGFGDSTASSSGQASSPASRSNTIFGAGSYASQNGSKTINAAAPPFQPRKRADTINAGSDNYYELRPRSGTTPPLPTGGLAGIFNSTVGDTVQSAFARLDNDNSQGQDEDTVAARDRAMQSQPMPHVPIQPLPARPLSRAGRSISMGTGMGANKPPHHRGHKPSKSFAAPDSPSVPSFEGGPPQFGSMTPTMPTMRGARTPKSNKAIPIVNPTNRNEKGKDDEWNVANNGKASDKKKPAPIHVPKPASFVSQNRFGALTEETESDLDTPHDSEQGGVTI